MNYRGIAAAVLLCSILAISVGCSKQVAKDEMRLYNMKAYEEGSREARISGRGMNGKFLEELQASFSKVKMPLTNETYAEDEIGNITYQYRINYDASQFITVYVYQDQAAREKGIKEIFGVTEGDANVAGGHNLIISDKETSIVYTSTGDKTDNYYSQVKKIAPALLAKYQGRVSS
ncbi:hypothetical protein C7121_17695 [Paenibacillus glucanolyticus]|jgi:hypothetical protein|uniref:DUF4367 domain-containing protein n=1 Tax=Paenibacillus glucanolyticus TaxID=59843 RepID=A0A163E7P7_9BACL|nr:MULTISPECIES: hypothetical protein [Paenibacillus]ANA83085.1 hypothetical protein A3958_25315 [Paenibacillus glucanolyticus]AVV57826.1 hypothetical protein C7121_17695 [Paenibacillus glucanolyticus]ETT34607.1 hypothetical protein C169_19654 [Paenibacillus sp. FSL R5-808]KZS43661.1 hypothetical protein AWU65_26580 [Paenibacillus glucanolyticus]MPY18173.1 hypothetical protein [Paenibacillus glucanolyticus]